VESSVELIDAADRLSNTMVIQDPCTALEP
jgi:hypothetical protein